MVRSALGGNIMKTKLSMIALALTLVVTHAALASAATGAGCCPFCK